MVDISAEFGRYGDSLDKPRREMGYIKRKPVQSRVLAVRALRSLDFGDVCATEPDDGINGSRTFSGVLTVSAVSGLVVFAMAGLGLTLVPAVCLVALVLVLPFSLLLMSLIPPRWNRRAIVSLWALTSIWLVVDDRSAVIMVTHMLPIALTVLGRWALRAGLLVRRIPLFVPAALVIVLAPVFTEDPWKFVASAGWRLALLALVAVGPLLVLVLLRLRKIPLDKVFERAAASVGGDVDQAVATGATMLRSRCVSRENWPTPKELNRFLRPAYAKPEMDRYAGRLRELTASTFRRRGIFRFLTLLAGTSAATYVLIYALIAVAMPPDLAEAWSGAVPTRAVIGGLWPGLTLELPLWPYTGVAALFSIVAAVGFLGAALTDEGYTNTVIDAVLGHLARLLLLVGAPYLRDVPSRG